MYFTSSGADQLLQPHARVRTARELEARIRLQAEQPDVGRRLRAGEDGGQLRPVAGELGQRDDVGIGGQGFLLLRGRIDEAQLAAAGGVPVQDRLRAAVVHDEAGEVGVVSLGEELEWTGLAVAHHDPSEGVQVTIGIAGQIDHVGAVAERGGGERGRGLVRREMHVSAAVERHAEDVLVAAAGHAPHQRVLAVGADVLHARQSFALGDESPGAGGDVEDPEVDGLAGAAVRADEQRLRVRRPRAELIVAAAPLGDEAQAGAVRPHDVHLLVESSAGRHLERQPFAVRRPVHIRHRIVESRDLIGPAAAGRYRPHLRRAADAGDEGDLPGVGRERGRAGEDHLPEHRHFPVEIVCRSGVQGGGEKREREEGACHGRDSLTRHRPLKGGEEC
ncbi:MAG TPA: hypothetical protein VE974_29620 [Thermoanaerobaculia bacterium]|nr:hypothetical protein [Thermoanaerobaculia bacterium]